MGAFPAAAAGDARRALRSGQVRFLMSPRPILRYCHDPERLLQCIKYGKRNVVLDRQAETSLILVPRGSGPL